MELFQMELTWQAECVKYDSFSTIKRTILTSLCFHSLLFHLLLVIFSSVYKNVHPIHGQENVMLCVF